MNYFLRAAMLFFVSGSTPAQDDVKGKYTAYNLCAETTQKDPHKAYEYCSDYLNKYPNDDAKLRDFAGRFIIAHKKVAQYLKSVPVTNFAEKTTRWAVYSPGLLAAIPTEESLRGDHSILIKREYGTFGEEQLLAKAESLYKNPDTVEAELLKNWGYLADNYVVLPEGQPKWWTGPVDTILGTDLVTTEAVLYYYNTSQAFRNKEGKLKENSFTFFSSGLKYIASIKKMDVYERAGRSFTNVYVANMTLTWAQVCGGLCGHGFTRNKIVVMSPSGEILEMFLDDPVNRSSWVS
jgi:hypothetical protein